MGTINATPSVLERGRVVLRTIVETERPLDGQSVLDSIIDIYKIYVQYAKDARLLMSKEFGDFLTDYHDLIVRLGFPVDSEE